RVDVPRAVGGAPRGVRTCHPARAIPVAGAASRWSGSTPRGPGGPRLRHDGPGQGRSRCGRWGPAGPSWVPPGPSWLMRGWGIRGSSLWWYTRALTAGARFPVAGPKQTLTARVHVVDFAGFDMYATPVSWTT